MVFPLKKSDILLGPHYKLAITGPVLSLPFPPSPPLLLSFFSYSYHKAPTKLKAQNPSSQTCPNILPALNASFFSLQPGLQTLHQL